MSIGLTDEWNRIRAHNQVINELRNNGTSNADYDELFYEYKKLVDNSNILFDRHEALKSDYNATQDEKQVLMQRLQEAGALLEENKTQLEKKQERIKHYATEALHEWGKAYSLREETQLATDSGYLAAITEQRIGNSMVSSGGLLRQKYHTMHEQYMESIIAAERSLRIEYARLALGLMGKSEAEIERIIDEDNHAIMDDINNQYKEGIREIRKASASANDFGDAAYHFIKEDLKKGGLMRAHQDAPQDTRKPTQPTHSHAEIIQGRLLSPHRKFGSLANNELEYQHRLNEVTLSGKYRDRILYTPRHEKADEELKQGLFDFKVRPDKTIQYALAFAVLDEYIRETKGLPPLTDAVSDTWRAEFIPYATQANHKAEIVLNGNHHPLMSAPANVGMTPEMAFHYLQSVIGEIADPDSAKIYKYQVNSGVDASGFDGNGYLFHLIYAGVKGSNLAGMGVRENNQGATIYNEGTLAILDREYNWMMPLAAEEFAPKFKIIAPKIDISHVMNSEEVESDEPNEFASNGFLTRAIEQQADSKPLGRELGRSPAED